MTRFPLSPRRWTRVSEAARRPVDMAEFARNMRQRMLVGRALEEDRVRIAYQPVVNAKAPDAIAFWEALVRIAGPEGKLLSPGEFLPGVEGTSLALLLDCQVLRLVLDQLAARPDLRISVNVGPASFADPEWSAVLMAALDRTPYLVYRLILEVTEETDIAATLDAQLFLENLRAAGISIALDDFGGGATSLRQLRDVRFDILKLDAGLCASLAEDPDAVALTRAMVGIARHFEMMTVAEHVESQGCAAVARRLGIDCLQGYLYGKPDLTVPTRGTARARIHAVQ